MEVRPVKIVTSFYPAMIMQSGRYIDLCTYTDMMDECNQCLATTKEVPLLLDIGDGKADELLKANDMSEIKKFAIGRVTKIDLGFIEAILSVDPENFKGNTREYIRIASRALKLISSNKYFANIKFPGEYDWDCMIENVDPKFFYLTDIKMW